MEDKNAYGIFWHERLHVKCDTYQRGFQRPPRETATGGGSTPSASRAVAAVGTGAPPRVAATGGGSTPSAGHAVAAEDTGAPPRVAATGGGSTPSASRAVAAVGTGAPPRVAATGGGSTPSAGHAIAAEDTGAPPIETATGGGSTPSAGRATAAEGTGAPPIETATGGGSTPSAGRATAAEGTGTPPIETATVGGSTPSAGRAVAAEGTGTPPIETATGDGSTLSAGRAVVDEGTGAPPRETATGDDYPPSALPADTASVGSPRGSVLGDESASSPAETDAPPQSPSSRTRSAAGSPRQKVKKYSSAWGHANKTYLDVPESIGLIQRVADGKFAYRKSESDQIIKHVCRGEKVSYKAGKCEKAFREGGETTDAMILDMTDDGRFVIWKIMGQILTRDSPGTIEKTGYSVYDDKRLPLSCDEVRKWIGRFEGKINWAKELPNYTFTKASPKTGKSGVKRSAASQSPKGKSLYLRW